MRAYADMYCRLNKGKIIEKEEQTDAQLCVKSFQVSCQMKDFNVVKVDSKGRIIVPYHIRDYLGLREGTELIITNSESKELRIFPLLEGTASIDVLISDVPGSLAKVMDIVSRNRAEILMSTSKIIERGKLAEWSAILDISKTKKKKLEKELKKAGIVKKVRIEEK